MLAAHQITTFLPRFTAATVEAPKPRRIAASVSGLSKQFRNTPVLKDINFDIAEGETLVLLGASGSGKTTILRIIAGLEHPDTGRVILHGRDVTDLPARERGVGVIFQSYALFPNMTVEQNIGYGLKIRRRNRKEIRETVDRLLELIRLTEHRRKYPSQLSGGQQQRVAIARTLAYQPEVVLFDEPFGALDAQTRTRLRSEIRALLRKVNVPAIFITHDQEEALELGDRIAVINAGHIEQIGTPREVYDQSASEYVATFLGRANLVKGVHHGQEVTLVFRPEDVRLGDEQLRGCHQLGTGIVKEVVFAGAYERLTVQVDIEDAEIVVTRLKPQTIAQRLEAGDRVRVGVVSFSVLPTLCGPLRTSAVSALKRPLDAENAKIRRGPQRKPSEGSNSSWN
ncbi:MAG TPA: ABC transporter ATP-binding protein [Pyrinomonadaceae bacterium]|nr:ABC transporter ATP-binding protein [Pyrinomonadaceae bacterium]